MNGKLWNGNDHRTVLLAALIGCVSMLGLSAILAAMVLGGVLDQKTLGLLAICTCFISVFVGGFLAARHAKQRKLVASLAVAATISALLALLRLLLWGNEPASVWPQLCCIFAASIFAGLLGSQKKKRPRRRKR